MIELAPLFIKKHHDKRIRKGHLWVYSNEVDIGKSPLTQFEAGQWVQLLDEQNKCLGIGYVNPHSLIAARIVARNPHTVIDQEFFRKRLQIAFALRQTYFDEPFYRWVFSDSDFLPGLIVDRFGEYAVMQTTTAGMHSWRDHIANALADVIEDSKGDLSGVLLKNDHSTQAVEGLPDETYDILGSVPDEVTVRENGVEFVTPVRQGQKTGWFYDHRFNRAQMQHWVKGKRVLDVFSYVGGWGVQAAAAGASEVVCIDASQLACEYVKRNAELNGCGGLVTAQQGKAFEVMKRLLDDGEKFDVVILDPPAFIKKKKDYKNGLTAYRRGNELAVRLIQAHQGVLVSGSCSMHLTEADLVEQIRAVSRHLDRDCQIVENYSQGVDHPVHPAIPETRYLKAVTAIVHRVL